MFVVSYEILHLLRGVLRGGRPRICPPPPILELVQLVLLRVVLFLLQLVKSHLLVLQPLVKLLLLQSCHLLQVNHLLLVHQHQLLLLIHHSLLVTHLLSLLLLILLLMVESIPLKLVQLLHFLHL